MKKQEKQITTTIKKMLRSFFSRLPIAALAISISVVLILWDMGKFDIPFLKRKDRREPLATETQTSERIETNEENSTLPKEEVSYGLYAEKVMDSLYDFSFLEEDERIIPEEDFDKNSHSIVKTRLPDKHYRYAFGYLIDPSGTVYRARDLKVLPESENYSLSTYRSASGAPLFYHLEEEAWCVFDNDSFSFVPVSFDPETQSRGIDLPMPASYGQGEENRILTVENGLYGYSLTRRINKWRNETVVIENQYAKAFPYSEGYAVMADPEGRVSIRNELGEEILKDLNLILPEKEGMEALGFHYFDNGLLRVVFATYDENGHLVETKEGVINPLGQEFPLPQGYTVISYYDGIFTVTNGKTVGHYSASGEWITHPIYADAQPFFEGVAVVKGENGKLGLVGLDGKEILPCTFDNITNFSDGTCLAYAKGIGSFLLTRVTGDYMPETEEKPPVTTPTTKITITRGPLNTFQPDEEPETLELPDPITTTTRPLLPEFWE